RRGLEEWHPLIEQRSIAGVSGIDRGRIRQPQQIVGTSGARAASRRRVPPMLHVAFDELTRRRQQDVGSTEIRSRVQERQDVLQLVAETERTAGLVRSASRPETATERLIEQPAIDQQVERVVGRPHLYGAEGIVPEPRRAAD